MTLRREKTIEFNVETSFGILIRTILRHSGNFDDESFRRWYTKLLILLGIIMAWRLDFKLSWDYYAKWNKSDEKGQKPYNVTHMLNIKQKVTN